MDKAEGQELKADDQGKTPQPEKVPYGKLFYWGRYVVSVALAWFLVNTFLTIFLDVLSQYNIQVVSTVVSALQKSEKSPLAKFMDVLSRHNIQVPESALAELTKPEKPLAKLLDVLSRHNIQVPDAALTELKEADKKTDDKTDSWLEKFLSRLLPSNPETAVILFASICLALILLRFTNRMLLAWTDNLMTARLQQRLHDRLLALGPTYHRAHDVGEKMTIVMQFAGGTQMLLRELISFPLVRGVSLVTAMFFITINVERVGETPGWLRLGLLGCIFILPVGGWFLAEMLRAAFTKVRDSQVALADEFTNSVSSPLEVQLMRAEEQRARAFGERIQTYVRNRLAAAWRNEVATSFQISTPILLQAAFLIYGVFFALKSGKPEAAGAILALYLFVPEAVQPIQDIITFVTGLNMTWPQVEKVVEVLEAEPEVKEKAGAVDLSPRRGEIVLENITFSYTLQGHKILDNLSYTFKQGQVTAVVARAGGGKSSLLNMVVRLRDPQEGRILIDGEDIASATLASLRRHVAKVSQFPLFITDTIRANLQLASATATDAELEAACRRTGLWTVLENAAGAGKDPLNYVLPRESSEGLSGGQRRLLAVTRSLLLQPTILLLDEPTTGIDAIGRAQVAAVLREVCRGLTVLLVDHDMEFISHFADWICCLEQGKFIETGSPQELAARPGLFRDLLEASEEAPATPSAQAPAAVAGLSGQQ